MAGTNQKSKMLQKKTLKHFTNHEIKLFNDYSKTVSEA